jgi:hypothetical protein
MAFSVWYETVIQGQQHEFICVITWRPRLGTRGMDWKDIAGLVI